MIRHVVSSGNTGVGVVLRLRTDSQIISISDYQPMFIAVDDTDSMRGNCTTFLATEIIRELSSDFDLIGNPRLVRLNPAVPWKTRGNGSLVMRFGKGTGMRHLIG